MTATLTLDEAGRLILPEDVVQVLGMKPGVAVKAEVTADRIELLKGDAPVITELARTPEGLLVLPVTGVKVDIIAAIKSEREERDRKLARH